MERFEEIDRTLLNQFAPHLRRALQLRARLQGLAIERNAALDALDRARVATLVVERDGRILYANTQAEAMLRETHGLLARNNRVTPTARNDRDKLIRLINTAIDTASAGTAIETENVLTISREDRLPLTAFVAPFRPMRDGFGAPVPAAIVFVRDPEKLTLASTPLQGLFGLTPAEAAIARALAEGQTVEAITKAHHISLNTVRTHLKSIFAKTGTRRQAELTVLILSSVAPLTK
jgi:DNA-binding CsgD family transcriptional regulator